MRILIYSYNYYPEPIGIAPLMTELAEGLVQRGHEVRVVTAMPNYPQRQIYEDYRGKFYLSEQRNGVLIQRSYVWIRPKPNLLDRLMLDASFVATSFVQAWRGWRPDVILLTAPPLPASVPAALLGLFRSCPVVVNLQDILPEAAIHVGLIRNKLMIRVFEFLEKFAYRMAHTISVITDGFVENLLGKNVPGDKIVCIPNWVDTDFIRPLPKEHNSFREEHGLQGKFVVLYSGNIALTQGLETVIQAAARLKDISEIEIVIVGEPGALQRLQRHCDRYQTENVKLLPFAPREKLPEMLAAADIGLIVQRHNVISFNMPSKTQVLLASGRPIIASVPAEGTAAKAVERSGGGILVPPENPGALAAAIRDLYANPAKAELLGKKGRIHAEEYYARPKALDQYEALFAAVVANPHGRINLSHPLQTEKAVAEMSVDL
ncbi:glycosyltransferase family 4 protein [Leptolyngbya sp. 'hensonii']|uniref:glycosyltransferase family 4 protein n=1 Tax=Leptolyngbya sp. 'hensonii' TaxID=1922337 RepID=UPI0009FA5F33|nr:glycosyltransferase family 4 protein [Leptolyngbya sp. 'hensonii']